ncbi:MAG: hypothetical protein BHV69_00930 [Bacteroidales bacterium 52_46]|nr:MAG: hypothetical protein BHV69_00930 [Bacteroidales bacterium 52_46]
MKEYDKPPVQTESTRVADLDVADKPREKALRQGIGALSNAELLAIVFGSGLPGRSVVDLSRDILRDNDNRLSRLARMSMHEVVKKYKGIGEAKAISLAAAFELGARCALDMKQLDPQVRGSETVYERMRGQMELLNYEEFRVVHLSRANRIIFEETVSRGGTASTLVDVKLVMKSALDKLSSGLIFVHNHPSGNLNPSPADDKLTRQLKSAAELLDIRVLDHIIITPHGYYSYNDNGRL